MKIHLPRHDVSAVPLQGGYVAKQCPVRAFHEHNTLKTFATEPVSDVQQGRMDGGIDFEAEVFKSIIDEATDGSLVVVNEDTTKRMVAATGVALSDEAGMILGGALESDPNGRRAGRTDVLVRVGNGSNAGYVPVDVKHHTLAKASKKAEASLPWSPFDSIDPLGPFAEPAVALDNAYRRDDGFQLAHYWRMLEAAGQAPGSSLLGPIGGIIDKSHRVWWIDLTEPTTERWWSEEPVSLLEWYDWEFSFRLDVIAQTLARNLHEESPPPVMPVRTGECSSCIWNEVCTDKLEASDHVSLLPGSTWERFVHFRRHDLLTRQTLASLDWATASIVHGASSSSPTYDLSDLHEDAESVGESTPVVEIVGKRRRQLLERLDESGIRVAADVNRLDRRTAALPIQGLGHLPSLIDIARAADADHPFRARGLQHVDVPRADIEVDLDMESTQSGVYLWGAQTTVRSPGTSLQDGYRPFDSWAELDPNEEARVLAGCWKYVKDCLDAATRAGLSFAVYFYTSAETTQIRRILSANPNSSGLTGLAEFVASDHWIDLHQVVKSQLVTGGGLGLKTIAPLAGFDWRDDDPGGEQSMLWHTCATESAETQQRSDARDRILRYNEDDVLATLAVREWMDDNRESIPAIETWEGATS
jgi:hypothetical protein